MIWQFGIAELMKFIDHLNSVSDSIKFTHEISESSINFLDTTVKYNLREGLSTTLFTKPTDKHSYLRFDSCHPPHIKQSLPYSQLLRIRHICIHYLDFITNSLEMICNFHNRGYPLADLYQQLLMVGISKIL